MRQLLNHVLETQHYFLGAARGQDAWPPGQEPPNLLGDADPTAAFTATRQEVLDAFGQEGVVEKTMPAVGIAFADQLLHGWDLAKATGQDATMPHGLAEAAYSVAHGRFSDEQRKGVFDSELPVADDASPQDRLLAHTGRQPG